MSGIWVGVSQGVVKTKDCRFWAENGMVRVEDARDNSYKALTVRQALLHLNGINDMLRASTRETDYYDEITAMQRFVTEMTEVIQKAREQGSPDDPSAVRDKVRRQKKVFSTADKAVSKPSVRRVISNSDDLAL